MSWQLWDGRSSLQANDVLVTDSNIIVKRERRIGRGFDNIIGMHGTAEGVARAHRRHPVFRGHQGELGHLAGVWANAIFSPKWRAGQAGLNSSSVDSYVDGGRGDLQYFHDVQDGNGRTGPA